jgi:type IV pilus assembly protein PilC
MPKYKYSAMDFNSKKISGFVDARDDEDLRRILRARNLAPVTYKKVEEKFRGYRLKANETAEFSRQLASMLGSGITLVRAMEILKGRDFKPALIAVYDKLYRDVQQGVTMSEAMRLQPNSFPELLVNMYASGEASGQLEQVASKMAVHYEKEYKLNKKVQSAMTYPMVLIVVTVIVVIVIFTLVLPTFFDLFEDMPLPLITQIVVAISGFLTGYWHWAIIGVLILIAVVQYLLKIWRVALWYDTQKLKMPMAGKLLKIIYTARFARTLSSLYASGVSIITALTISATIVGNKFIQTQFDELIKNVRNGEPLSEAVGAVNGFDKKLATSIMIGEESGNLDSMLVSTAESFDYEAEIATTRMVQILEPMLIVFMALIICGIMLAVMMPIFSLYTNIANL